MVCKVSGPDSAGSFPNRLRQGRSKVRTGLYRRIEAVSGRNCVRSVGAHILEKVFGHFVSHSTMSLIINTFIVFIS